MVTSVSFPLHFVNKYGSLGLIPTPFVNKDGSLGLIPTPFVNKYGSLNLTAPSGWEGRLRLQVWQLRSMSRVMLERQK